MLVIITLSMVCHAHAGITSQVEPIKIETHREGMEKSCTIRNKRYRAMHACVCVRVLCCWWTHLAQDRHPAVSEDGNLDVTQVVMQAHAGMAGASCRQCQQHTEKTTGSSGFTLQGSSRFTLQGSSGFTLLQQ